VYSFGVLGNMVLVFMCGVVWCGRGGVGVRVGLTCGGYGVCVRCI